MKNKQVVYLFAALAILASCKKDNTKTKVSGIDGTYTFNGVRSMTNDTLINDNGIKIITPMEWTSDNNQGTFVFDNGQVTVTNFNYSVNLSQIESYFYHDNIFYDSVSSAPTLVTILPTNSVSTYQLVGSDSIYFPNGGFVGITPSTGTFVNIKAISTTNNPGGGHFKLSGNQLTLNIRNSTDSTFSLLGVMYTVQESVVSSIVLQKQ